MLNEERLKLLKAKIETARLCHAWAEDSYKHAKRALERTEQQIRKQPAIDPLSVNDNNTLTVLSNQIIFDDTQQLASQHRAIVAKRYWNAEKLYDDHKTLELELKKLELELFQEPSHDVHPLARHPPTAF